MNTASVETSTVEAHPSTPAFRDRLRRRFGGLQQRWVTLRQEGSRATEQLKLALLPVVRQELVHLSARLEAVEAKLAAIETGEKKGDPRAEKKNGKKTEKRDEA